MRPTRLTIALVAALLAAGTPAAFARPGMNTNAGAGPAANSHALANTNGPASADRDFGRDRAEDRAGAKANANSNGLASADRDTGRDRAEDRMSAQGKAHSKAKTKSKTKQDIKPTA